MKILAAVLAFIIAVLNFVALGDRPGLDDRDLVRAANEAALHTGSGPIGGSYAGHLDR